MKTSFEAARLQQGAQVGWADVSCDWRVALPRLVGSRVTLREVGLADARPLAVVLAGAEVTRFAAPLPSSTEAFERFIEQAHDDRAAGRGACFAVVPAGCSRPVGLVQLRLPDAALDRADWVFWLASQFWGTGVFQDAARLVVEFAFSVGVRRLEARAPMANGRANGALRKLGAVQEGVLRRSFRQAEECQDQLLWTILDEDWRCSRDKDTRGLPRIH